MPISASAVSGVYHIYAKPNLTKKKKKRYVLLTFLLIRMTGADSDT